MYNSLDTITSQPSQVMVGIGRELKALQSRLIEKNEQLISASKLVKHEKPFTGWLHEYLQNVLDPHGFTVDTEGIIIKPIAPLNEYVTSQPDLLIFHTNNVETLNCLYVQTGTDDEDASSSLDDVMVTGFAGEFKLDEAKGDSMRKMSAIAICLAKGSTWL